MRKNQLSAETIRRVIAAATREKLSHGEVAIKFGITSTLVHRLVKLHKTDPDSLRTYESKRRHRLEKVELTVSAAQEILATQHNLWKSSQVTALVKKKYGLDVTDPFVSNILRNVLKMRYKRVVHLAP